MSELSQRILWARVDYSSNLALTAWAQLEKQAPSVAGLAQSDAVQVVTMLAGLRDLVAAPGYQRIGEFTPEGHPVATYELGGEYGARVLAEIDERKNRIVQIVGDAPFRSFRSPDDPLPAWGRKLALALDQVQVQMARQKQGAAIPFAAEPAWFLGIPPVTAVVVIVAGAALAIIGAVAAWRFFDPDFRQAALLVKGAADDYAKRLDVMQRTGAMPPPSQLEVDAAPTVRKMAAERQGTGLTWGLGIAGGLTVGFVGASVLANRTAAA